MEHAFHDRSIRINTVHIIGFFYDIKYFADSFGGYTFQDRFFLGPSEQALNEHIARVTTDAFEKIIVPANAVSVELLKRAEHLPE